MLVRYHIARISQEEAGMIINSGAPFESIDCIIHVK
jgi:hypothetical protein